MPNISGQVDAYRWVERDLRIWDLEGRILQHFEAHHLLVACFDGGALLPTPSELPLGWQITPAGLLSPPLFPGLEIPADNHDEWWVFSTRDDADKFPGNSQAHFVNYLGWTLRSPEEIVVAVSPGEPGDWNWLRPIQASFWQLVKAHRPVAYLSGGHRVIAASSNHDFIQDVSCAEKKPNVQGR